MKIVVQSAAALVLGFALVAQAGRRPIPRRHAARRGIAAKLMVRDSVRDLRVESLRSQRRNDVMVVQAEIANTSGLNSRLYYRFRWLDADGMQVGDDEAWKPLTFLNRQNQMIKGVAISPQATDFRIEMSAESP